MRFFKGWKAIEIAWLFVAVISTLGLSLYWGDSPLAIVSSLTGIVCVVLTAKRRISCYVFGLVNVIAYIILSLEVRFYGEVMLNGLYYLPMQFIGFYLWNKHTTDNNEIQSLKLTFKNRIIMLSGAFLTIILYGLFLKSIGGSLPFVDSTSTILSVLAMYLSVRRYFDQWILWIVVNVVSIIMWAVSLQQGAGDLATLLMWVVYLINSIYGYKNWSRESVVQ